MKNIKVATHWPIFIYLAVTLLFTPFSHATEKAGAHKKTYKEFEFIKKFRGKNKKFVLETLGAPAQKQSPIKPGNAGNFVGEAEPSQVKPEVIEMWYYHHLVQYNTKQTFKNAELTFINDMVSNITFVN